MSNLGTFNKQPAEVVPLTIDFGSEMATGETLASAVSRGILQNGVVDNTILQGSPQITGNKATQIVKAGSSGVTYTLEITATTNLGSVYQMEITVPVAEIP